MSLFHLAGVGKVFLLLARLFPFLSLNLVHEFRDFDLQALLKLLFGLCIFLELVSGRCDRDLKLSAAFLAFSDESLILGHIIL